MSEDKSNIKNTAPLVLAVDSTAKVASAAVTRGEELLYTATLDTGYTHSETLLPMIEGMLAALRLNVRDIGVFACAAGPGSFTGVRIGAATVKGLAFGTETPCAGVSSLEALAYNMLGLEGVFCPSMDARRAQVYNALFRCRGGKIERITSDRAIGIKELAEELSAYTGEPLYLCGDAHDILCAALPEYGIKPAQTPVLLRRQNAYSVALCAYKAYLSGDAVTGEGLKPVYLRMPQAERERLAKNNS